MFYIGLYRENVKKSCLRYRALIFGMYHYQSLFKLYPSKIARTWGTNVLHRLIKGKLEKIKVSDKIFFKFSLYQPM